MKPHWDNLLYSIASGIPNHLFQLNDLVSRVLQLRHLYHLAK